MNKVQRLAAPRDLATYVAGTQALAAGTTILTLDGALPVEHLLPGDRVITRRGARPLRDIRRMELPTHAKVVQITTSALGGKPDRDVWLLPDQQVLIRDWRAQILCGLPEAALPIARLIDGDYIRWSQAPARAACLVLRFAEPEVVYADGLELATASAVPA